MFRLIENWHSSGQKKAGIFKRQRSEFAEVWLLA